MAKSSRYAFGRMSRKALANTMVTIKLADLNKLIDLADKALDGDSNDAEHDALYKIRETLAEYSTDPLLRATNGDVTLEEENEQEKEQ